jgi:hypothetical protein
MATVMAFPAPSPWGDDPQQGLNDGFLNDGEIHTLAIDRAAA